MASVQLADTVIPAVYESYTAVDSPELTAFYQSGVIARNPLLDNAFSNGGTLAVVPFWKDLDSTVEPNYSSDVTGTNAVPQKVTADKMQVRIANLNQAYSAMDLAGELAGSNPMQRIRNRFGTYWTRQWQRRVISAAQGVLAANIAQNASDMVSDISIADGNNAATTNLFSRKAFTGAAFTLGDAFEKIVAIGVHSVVYKRMVDNDDITFIKPSAGTTEIPTFLGKIVIVDDGLPVVAGATSGFVYTSVLFGAGAFGYGEGTPAVPVEVWRNPQGGNGGGEEQLWERKTWILHPFGYKWTETTLTAQSPKLADLKLAANWNRMIERKNVPLAFLKTNG